MPEALASWRDTPTRESIVSFTEEAAARLPAEERVAVFDNDGTLWCEKPIPIQLDFILRRFAQQAEEDESLRTLQPWKAAYEHDLHWLGEAMVKHYKGDAALPHQAAVTRRSGRSPAIRRQPSGAAPSATPIGSAQKTHSW